MPSTERSCSLLWLHDHLKTERQTKNRLMQQQQQQNKTNNFFSFQFLACIFFCFICLHSIYFALVSWTWTWAHDKRFGSIKNYNCLDIIIAMLGYVFNTFWSPIEFLGFCFCEYERCENSKNNNSNKNQ